MNVILGSQVCEIRGTDVVLDTSEGALTVRNDFVFILPGGEMPYDFLRQIGIEIPAKVIQ